MEIDRVAEWQRLTEHYREMYDDELRNLAAEIADLTEVAQQVLRDEMKRRRLCEPREASQDAKSPTRIPAPGRDSSFDLPNGEGAAEESDLPVEFTWKTLLCECETSEEAWQIYQVLKRAGIESWIESPGSKFSASTPRVVVAADQLDQAREIAVRPIPQEIIDESRMEEPEYDLPSCPRCGAAEPTLESVDPVNRWSCEACGHQWTEPAEEA
jgi:hypothetical protein